MSKEQAVRDAAAKLQEAILDARAGGLVVTWPARVEDLSFIAVSEGRKALTPEEIGQAAKAAAEREQAGEKAEVVEHLPIGSTERVTFRSKGGPASSPNADAST